ncbi:MAG: glycosyltransferase family 2 protein [Cyanobacteria bacterium J06560_6]
MKVSVIIPNYNRAAIVGDTIENMLRQSLRPYEVIVIDDGSTDDSVSVIRSFGGRVHLIQQQNQGPGAARNAGLKVASGQFIQLMDSDDLASLNKLETQAQALIENRADIAYSPWAKVFIKKDSVELQDTVLQQQQLPISKTPVGHFLTGWSVVLQQCLLSALLVKRVGFYRTDMWTCDDSDFFLRMLLLKPKLAFSDASLTLYRQDDYGKVTASGATDIKRVEDWGRFLVSAYQGVNQHPWVQHSINQPKFLINVWKTLTLLEQFGSSDRALIRQLSEFLSVHSSIFPLSIYSRFSEILKGVQQRVKGHRWPSAYQSGTVTVHQKTLLRELGFSVV